MIRRLLLFFLAISFFPACAHAQVSVYFTSVNTHFSNIQNGQTYNPSTATYTNLFTTSWPAQFGGGVTMDLIKGGPAHLGLDLRGSTNHSSTGADTVMFGPRLAAHVPIFHVKPYLAAEGGYVATRTNGSTTTVTGNTIATSSVPITNRYAAWEAFAGVDYPLISHIDFRVVEIGTGKGYLVTPGISTINFGNTNTQISLFSIDTGVVVHF